MVSDKIGGARRDQAGDLMLAKHALPAELWPLTVPLLPSKLVMDEGFLGEIPIKVKLNFTCRRFFGQIFYSAAVKW